MREAAPPTKVVRLLQTDRGLPQSEMHSIRFCGFLSNKKSERNDKYMKHPNGYGTVAKLSGNRRRPFVIRKTIGWDDRGYPVYLTVGYAATREAGLILLAQYNNEPWNIDQNKITFEELFELWKETEIVKLGESNQRSLKAAYKHCTNLYKMKYREIRKTHMQEAIDNCGKGYSTEGAIKNLFGHLDNFAFELEIINKQYSKLTTAAPIPETSKQPFTDDEIDLLWKHKEAPWIDTILIFLYSGWRISELLGLRTADVDLDAQTMTGGVKTRSGKGRIIPIHSKIIDFVKARYGPDNEYLLTFNGKRLAAPQYYKLWESALAPLGIDHKVHETRHTFRSRLDSAGGNKRCIDLIMGHKSNDVGERVYTHKTLQELKDTIELITR